jgi:hypothetical protein
MTLNQTLKSFPIQKRICNKPISLQEGITALLNNVSKKFLMRKGLKYLLL